MSRGLPRVLVLTGTSDHPFTRLLDALPALARRGVEVRVQSRTPPPAVEGVVALGMATREALAQELALATVVVTHGGSGSCFEAIAAGHRPLVVPRLAAWKEHVDDHQVDVARELSRQGVAEVLDGASLASLPDLVLELAARPRPPAVAPRSLGPRLRALLRDVGAPARGSTPAWTVRRVDAAAFTAAVGRAGWAHPLQSAAWGEARRGDGWSPAWWLAARRGAGVVALQILTRRMPGLPAYAPYGPVLPREGDACDGARALLTSVARQRAGGLVWAPSASPVHARLVREGLGHALAAPSATGLLSLEGDEAMLAKMRGTWRWTLRKAVREGETTVTWEDPLEFVPSLLERVGVLAKEKGFPAPLSPTSGRAFARGAEAAGVRLLCAAARHGGVVAQRQVVAVVGTTAVLLWSAQEPGADPGDGRVSMWESIRRSRGLGARMFDLSGIDPQGNPGVASYKRGLGPDEVKVPGLRWIAPSWLPPLAASELARARRLRRTRGDG